MSDINVPGRIWSSALRRFVTRLAARSGFPVRRWPFDEPRPKRPQRTAPPMVALFPDDGDVTWLSRLVRETAGEAGTAAVLEASTAGAGNPAATIEQLIAAAGGLHSADTRLRFPRLHLVSYLASLTPTRRASAELVDALVDKLREYRAGPAGNAGSGPGVVSALQTLNPWPIFVAVFAFVAPELLFRLWFYGAPGLGRECRWLRDQHNAIAPGRPFGTFVLGLGVNAQGTLPAGTEVLATRAFLADLRAAYRPRPGRKARSWRWGAPPVLVLDQVAGDLPGLLTTARDRTQPDPLLVLAVDADQAGKDAAAWQVTRVAHDQHQDDEEGWSPSALGNRGNGRGLLATAGVIGVAAVAALALVVVPRFQLFQHHPSPSPVPSSTGSLTGKTSKPKPSCPPQGKPAAMTQMVAWTNGGTDGDPTDIECVGYSTTVPFVSPPPGLSANPTEDNRQEARLVYDQEQVFVMDKKADESGRPVITLVYFAGLTFAPQDDYDSGEAEELEGLFVAQQLAWSSSGPVLQVVVANGGSQMKGTATVVPLLLSLFADNPTMLGVVGMDRSIELVKQAITKFGGKGIPVVATTLSANGIGAGDPDYFQLVPDNTQEAELILSYIKNAVTAYFSEPASIYYSGGSATARRILVYYPDTDPGDLYITTLVADLQRERKTESQFSSLPAVETTTARSNNLCGPDTVVVYAGRHDREPNSKFDDFTNFLQTIARTCPVHVDRPFVIADDGVSRSIANFAARLQAMPDTNMWVSFVTKAVDVMQTGTDCLDGSVAAVPDTMSSFCRAYATVVAGLQKKLNTPLKRIPLLWTGERVSLAYDAAELFIVAADDRSGQTLISRSEIRGAFKSGPYPGVTGTSDFRKSAIGSNTAGGMPLAIVRVQVADKTATPTTPICEYTSASTQILGFGSTAEGYSSAGLPYLPCPALTG